MGIGHGAVLCGLASVDNQGMLWDIFCRVVDNFGYIGVCWRLSADLAARGHPVRLWVDDASALQWMAPGAFAGERIGGLPGVQVLDWAASQNTAYLATLPPADVWVEGFGCEIAPEFIAACAHSPRATGLNGIKLPVWINLEYLSAEPYVERCHALPSPVLHGFYPPHRWAAARIRSVATAAGLCSRQSTRRVAKTAPD